MRGLNEVQGIYISNTSTGWQQDLLCINARRELEKIAKSTGIKLRKTAYIAVRRDARKQQETGLEQLNEMLRKIRETDSKAEAIKWGLVAAGYADGIHCGDLISKSELDDVIEVIDQTYKEAELRIKTTKHPFRRHIIRRWVWAWNG